LLKNNLFPISRRNFLTGLIGSGVMFAGMNAFSCRNTDTPVGRRFHLCLSPFALDEFPEIPGLARQAGVTDIWLAAFLYGHWHRTPAEVKKIASRLEHLGFAAHIINVPLGHPGNALGVSEETISSTPPLHWKNACTADGQLYSGTSIHPPAIAENVAAMKLLQEQGFDIVFLDDDFRVAKFPGIIGGCFCAGCQADFQQKYGYSAADWDGLLEAVTQRNPTPVLRAWVDYWCDQLFGMFVAQQQAAPKMVLGNMIMYLGAEKAGLALEKFRDVPFRVGELMFNDPDFSPVKGKTDELFSALFHRRFARPELAYSETTAFPADQLSAANMAAKLTVSLITDVRNTMFMSGLTPFPATHWNTLGPAMRQSAQLHARIAGHRPQGPFKHFWGWDSRLVGRDKPFSLFLATGVPFAVVDELPADGWVFLSDEDALAVAQKRLASTAANLVVRRQAGVRNDNLMQLDETLADLFALKQRILPELKGVPYVAGENPAVFAWYPSARSGLVWNVTETRQTYSIVRDGDVLQSITMPGLGVVLVEGV
jgi:hypothetical protein